MSWSFLFSPTESAESFTIPSLWRWCLRVQCPVINPVSYLKFSLQWLLQTLDLPQSKSPSSLVCPSPPVSFQICTVSPKTLNQSSAGSFIFLPLPLCLLLKRTLSIWGKLGMNDCSPGEIIPQKCILLLPIHSLGHSSKRLARQTATQYIPA